VSVSGSIGRDAIDAPVFTATLSDCAIAGETAASEAAITASGKHFRKKVIFWIAPGVLSAKSVKNSIGYYVFKIRIVSTNWAAVRRKHIL
jgi:hypothetical protein